MRGLSFSFFLVIFVITAAEAVIWPYWDYYEASFVRQLLAHMQPEKGGQRGVWIGPGVETDATALVTGRLTVKAAPETYWELDWVGGRQYQDCAVAYQQMEVYRSNFPLWGHGWRAYGQPHMIPGASIQIGDWGVDSNFFRGELIAHKQRGVIHAKDDGRIKCPAGNPEACRVVESCVPLAEYSVLGNRHKIAEDQWGVMLPNESLVDYPLVQPEVLNPDIFGANYTRRIAERVMVYPIYQAAGLFCCGILLLLLSRRELVYPLSLLASVERTVIWIFKSIITTNRTMWDYLTMWMTLTAPFLPIAAYQYGPEPAVFSLLMQLSICGLIFLGILLVQRMRTDPATLPQGRDEVR